MNEPYLFEKAIGQQMGDLCRLAVGDAKVTQTGEIVTLNDMSESGSFSGVSVEVPYTEGGVSAVNVTRCGKNLLSFASFTPPRWLSYNSLTNEFIVDKTLTGSVLFYTPLAVVLPPAQYTLSVFVTQGNITGNFTQGTYLRNPNAWGVSYEFPRNTDLGGKVYTSSAVVTKSSNEYTLFSYAFNQSTDLLFKCCLSFGDDAADYEPYTGDTYTITLPADFYGGTVNLTAGTVTSLYASDGSLLPGPVVSDIDPVTIPILAGVNNIWADVGTMTVSYYRADAETFRPALWYPTIYRGLQSARYLIKSVGGAVTSFSDAVAAPLVGLRVALPWSAEGYDAVTVTRCGKNLFNINGETSYVYPDGNVRVENNSVMVDVIAGGAASRIYWSKIYKKQAYAFSAKHSDGTGVRVFSHTQFNGGTYNAYYGGYFKDFSDSFNLVPTNNFDIGIIIKQNPSTSGTAYNVQLELGDTATAYEPYNGDTYTITLPTTIYGGYLDAVTGQLVATHDANGNTLANQKLYFLPPVNIDALAGVNNVWSDAGDVTVSYRVEQ